MIINATGTTVPLSIKKEQEQRSLAALASKSENIHVCLKDLKATLLH